MKLSKLLACCFLAFGFASGFATAEPEQRLSGKLSGKKVAMLIADNFNAVEGFYPYLRLQEEGAEVTLIGEKANTIYSGRGRYDLVSDISIEDADPQAYDILVVPGGGAPKIMRENPSMVKFAKSFLKDPRKWVAAVCHGPQLLAATQSIEGIKLTGWPDIEGEISGAKADWQRVSVKSKNVVIVDVESKVISSPGPWTIDQFTRAIATQLSK